VIVAPDSSSTAEHDRDQQRSERQAGDDGSAIDLHIPTPSSHPVTSCTTPPTTSTHSHSAPSSATISPDSQGERRCPDTSGHLVAGDLNCLFPERFSRVRDVDTPHRTDLLQGDQSSVHLLGHQRAVTPVEPLPHFGGAQRLTRIAEQR
jgi:hypothetical protein